MDKENLKKKLFELYEKLERDKELYKEFIANEDKFLQDRGYDPVEVKELFQGITKERNNILKGVLEDQDKIIPYYWLPKWCGNYIDPSARILPVYD